MEEKDAEKSMKEVLLEIRDAQKKAEETKKEKKFKLPWSSKPNKGQLKKGYATFIYVHENKEIEFFKAPIDEGAMRKKDNFHVATAKYGMTYKGKPVFFVPSWNVEPFSPEKDLQEAEKKEATTMGQRYVFNKMKMDVIKDPKKGLSLWLIIGGLVVLGVLAFVLSKGNIKLA